MGGERKLERELRAAAAARLAAGERRLAQDRATMAARDDATAQRIAAGERVLAQDRAALAAREAAITADAAQRVAAAELRLAQDRAALAAREARAPPGFWTAPTAAYDPKLQFRYKVEIAGMGLEDARAEDGDQGDEFADGMEETAGPLVWYAKTIDKPGFNVTDLTKDVWFNNLTKADPLLTVDKPKFKTVSMTLIDPTYPNATRKLVRFLRRSGFNETQAYKIAQGRGGPVRSYIDTVGLVNIYQLDSRGETIERWTLVSAYPAEVDFGKLDYSSNDPVEITVKWGYKSFQVWFPDLGKELAYPYFAQSDGAAGQVVADCTARRTKEYNEKVKASAAFKINNPDMAVYIKKPC